MCGICVKIELCEVPCCMCGKTPTVFLQLDGGDYEDSIGRFLCKKHFKETRSFLFKSIVWPANKTPIQQEESR